MKKKVIAYLLLIALLGITVSASISQQNQNVPKTDTEVEKLKIQLQTVENEKMEVETKLAEANAKLINTDVDKLKGELRESNNDWLRTWNHWFIGIVTFIVLISGAALLLVLKTLIEKGIEKRVDRFKDAIEQVNKLKGLEKEHAASVLESNLNIFYSNESYAESINVLLNEVLLEVFEDKTRRHAIRDKAAEVLADRNYSPLVSPILEYLNDAVDSDLNLDPEWETPTDIGHYVIRQIRFVEEICTDEAHQGLKQLLNRLIKKEPQQMNLFLSSTVYSFAKISVDLNIRESAAILKSAVSLLHDPDHNLRVLAEYFDELNAPVGIKEIYNVHAKGEMPDVEKKCLELLEKYDPDFVRGEREEKAAETNTEGEEPDESKPTE